VVLIDFDCPKPPVLGPNPIYVNKSF
jgi:hypothetical protein